MKPADEKFLKRWEPSHARGRRQYMLVTGVLCWGLPMFVVMTFFVRDTANLDGFTVLLRAALWLSGGLLFGALTWALSERRYRRLTQLPGP